MLLFTGILVYADQDGVRTYEAQRKDSPRAPYAPMSGIVVRCTRSSTAVSYSIELYQGISIAKKVPGVQDLLNFNYYLLHCRTSCGIYTGMISSTGLTSLSPEIPCASCHDNIMHRIIHRTRQVRTGAPTAAV